MIIRTLALMLAATVLLVPAQPAAQATPDNYTPRAGVTFNSPLGDTATQRAIFRKILRSADSSPRGSEIYMFTWNFLTRQGTDTLLRAQRRGVRVRLLMAESNNIQIENRPFRRLRHGLREGNHGRPKARRSWARLCEDSCRGRNGEAHSKFFLFSRAGRARRVVMQGSANLTLASTSNQWNDIYTHVGNRKAWDFALRTFHQAAKDRPARRQYLTAKVSRTDRLLMYPNVGSGVRDPVMVLLDKVACRGARNTASGRTILRIAPDVIRNARGMALAKKVRALWNRGCDVKIGYTVVGIDIGRMLRDKSGRGPVPMKHLVQDFDGDGEFDNYFHLKAMSIVGNVAGDRSNAVVLNGSSNWSGLGKISDENLGVYWRTGLTRRYQKHIDYWYNNFPSVTSTEDPGTTARTTSSEEQLVFGFGKEAVYEDGTPVSDGTFDPFAQMSMD